MAAATLRSRLPAMRKAIKEEPYRQLMPGYVRRFLTASAPLVGLRMEGDSDAVFQLAQDQSAWSESSTQRDRSLPGQHTDGGLTFYRPTSRSDVIWLHPGEPVFDRFCDVLLSRCKNEARRGAVFLDPRMSIHPISFISRECRWSATNRHPSIDYALAAGAMNSLTMSSRRF